MINPQTSKELNKIAQAMVAPKKGILAADESFSTIEKRFMKINLPSTEENRRAYREMLLTANGISEFISGIILFDETIRQKTQDGRTFVLALESAGIFPGIKVDQGTIAFEKSEQEKVTQGLIGLPERLKEYVSLGAKFAKWRAVILIDEQNNLPTEKNIRQNVKDLAQYAKDCQKAGLVPIVEPEVLMDGGHSIDKCAEITEKMLKYLFEELEKAGVAIKGTILKTNMVLPGKEITKATPADVAKATIDVLKKVLPDNLPGVVFLSGGQSEVEATENLSELNKTGSHPWQLSFSYGRALQDSALKIWNGKQENVKAAQVKFYHRAKMNSFARTGKYKKGLEKD